MTILSQLAHAFDDVDPSDLFHVHPRHEIASTSQCQHLEALGASRMRLRAVVARGHGYTRR